MTSIRYAHKKLSVELDENGEPWVFDGAGIGPGEDWEDDVGDEYY